MTEDLELAPVHVLAHRLLVVRREFVVEELADDGGLSGLDGAQHEDAIVRLAGRQLAGVAAAVGRAVRGVAAPGERGQAGSSVHLRGRGGGGEVDEDVRVEALSVGRAVDAAGKGHFLLSVALQQRNAHSSVASTLLRRCWHWSFCCEILSDDLGLRI